MQVIRGVLPRRLVGFALLPVISALSPLVLLPVIARSATVAEWVAVALGQSIGALGAILVAYGWPVTGPVKVSSATPLDRRVLYLESVHSRVVTLLVAGPLICGLAALWAAPGSRLLAAATAIATATAGLSPSWFSVGEGKPGRVALFDTVPRLGMALVSSLLVAWSGVILWYPLLLLLGTLGGAAAFSRPLLARPDVPRGRPLRTIFRMQLAATAMSLAAGTYSVGAVALVSACATVPQSAQFASGMRIYQFMLLGLSAVSQAVLADTRLGQPDPKHLSTALLLQGGVGVSGFLGLAVLGPSVSRLLFTPDLAMGRSQAVFFGLAYCALAFATFVAQQLLIPLNRNTPLWSSVVAGTVVAVPTTVLLAQKWGATGGAIALAAAEGVVLAWSVLATAMPRRKPGRVTGGGRR